MAKPSPIRKGSSHAARRRVRASAAEFPPDGTTDLFPGESVLRGNHDPLTQGAEASLHPPLSRGVPKSLIKFLIGLFLLPVAWVLTETFLQAFTTSLKHGLLATQSFGCFAAGAVLFGILYLIIPSKALMLPYVLGHEVTHALWVWIFGGKVSDHFHVSLDGGHVITDRVNTWIVLSPYFFPIYSVLVVTIYAAASCVADLSSYRWVLFLLLGLTMAFHLAFTFLLIIKGQPDLHYGGTFFSLMVIYLINLLVIMGLLLATSHIVTPQAFIGLLLENGCSFVDTCAALGGWVVSLAGELYSDFAKP